MEGKGRHSKAKGVGWRHHLADGIQQVCAQQHNRSSATSARCARLPHLNQLRAKSPVVASDVHNCVHLRHVQPEGTLSQHQLPRLRAVPAAREGTHRQCLLSKGSLGGRDAFAHSARLLGGAPKPVLQGACGQFAPASCMLSRPVLAHRAAGDGSCTLPHTCSRKENSSS